MKQALLLIAHGSRVDAANDDLRRLADQLRAHSAYPIVEPCYLELAGPDIPAAARLCVEQGALQIILLPYFLSAGLHVRRDLERARKQLKETHPAVDFRLAEPIGPHPLMLQIILERARQADPLPNGESI